MLSLASASVCFLILVNICECNLHFISANSYFEKTWKTRSNAVKWTKKTISEQLKRRRHFLRYYQDKQDTGGSNKRCRNSADYGLSHLFSFHFLCDFFHSFAFSYFQKKERKKAGCGSKWAGAHSLPTAVGDDGWKTIDDCTCSKVRKRLTDHRHHYCHCYHHHDYHYYQH